MGISVKLVIVESLAKVLTCGWIKLTTAGVCPIFEIKSAVKRSVEPLFQVSDRRLPSKLFFLFFDNQYPVTLSN